MKLRYSEYAVQQLENILEFLVIKQGVPFEKAFEIREQIISRANRLMDYPLSGPLELHLDKFPLVTRRVVSGNYKILYTIDGDNIFITDIFDSRQDPNKMKG
jgi:plasmid stabilization system protein ParE